MKRKQLVKAQYHELSNGVYLDGEIKIFERQDVLGVITIMMPTDFFEMPTAYAQIKYPSSFRPDFILTHPSMSMTLCFNLFLSNLVETSSEEFATQMKEILLTEAVGLNFSEIQQIEVDKEHGYWFEFRSHGMDEDIYNMMLVIKIKNHILQVIFNCPLSEQLNWKPVVLQIWESIEEKEEDA